jgi:methyltransferase (TIGR00027 family)
VALRTYFIDESLRTAIEKGLGQVVLLGAGLDGRGYRLPWAAYTRLFELDTVEMLDFKQAVIDRIRIDARAQIIPVAGDLKQDWPTALGRAGFSAEQPTVWVIEGLMGYLTPTENDQLIARVSQRSAPGSLLIAVYADGDPLTILKSTEDRGDQSTDYLRDMVTVGPDAEPEPWLAGHGWTATISTIRHQAHQSGRGVPPAMDPDHGGVECWLVNAHLHSA